MGIGRASTQEGLLSNSYEFFQASWLDEPGLFQFRQGIARRNSPTLFILLVGISDYQSISKLQGSIQDVAKMENYLNSIHDFKTNILTLKDEHATRVKIIEAFKNIRDQIQPQDTFLFYFSGHVGSEIADLSIWSGEMDGLLEGIVCFDGYHNQSSSFLLTNVEILYLINEVYNKSRPHILAIFDVNFSWTNRHHREAVIKEGELDTQSQLNAYPQRQWNEFLFSGQIEEPKATNSANLSFLSPTFIQLSYYGGLESASEKSNESIFTKALLKTLRDSSGNISYLELFNRIQQYIKTGDKRGAVIDIPNNREVLLNSGFLNRVIDTKKTHCGVVHIGNNWQINVGTIHGLTQEHTINIIDSETQEAHIVRLKPDDIFVDYTWIESEGLDISRSYRGEIIDLSAKELRIELKNHNSENNAVRKIVDAIQEASIFSIFSEESKADYTLHFRDEEIYFTLPADPYRPIIRPISLNDSSGNHLIDNLHYISRWHFIKSFQNNKTGNELPTEPLKIELTIVKEDGSSNLIDISSGSAELHYEKNGKRWGGEIRIRVTNTTERNLYICVPYLSKEFQCFLGFIPEKNFILGAGISIDLGFYGRDSIDLVLGSVEQEYNWPETKEYLKFIASTDPFNADALDLDEIPAPFTTDKRNEKSYGYAEKGVTRALEMTNENLTFTNYTVQTLALIFKNPLYNQVSSETIRQLIEWEETSYYAKGLYSSRKLLDNPLDIGVNSELKKNKDDLKAIREVYERLQTPSFSLNYTSTNESFFEIRRLQNNFEKGSYALFANIVNHEISEPFKSIWECLMTVQKRANWLKLAQFNNSKAQFGPQDFEFEVEVIEGIKFDRFNRIADNLGNKRLFSPDTLIQCSYKNDLPPAIRFKVKLASGSQITSCYAEVIFPYKSYGALLVEGQLSLNERFKVAEQQARLRGSADISYPVQLVKEQEPLSLFWFDDNFTPSNLLPLKLKSNESEQLWFAKIIVSQNPIDFKLHKLNFDSWKQWTNSEAGFDPEWAVFSFPISVRKRGYNFEGHVKEIYGKRKIIVHDDLQKFRWGGEAKVNGYTLSAQVSKTSNSGSVYRVSIAVESSLKDDKRQIAIFLHDTFSNEIIFSRFEKGLTEIEVTAYEAFTIGAYIEDGTELELDLMDYSGYPEKFYYKHNFDILWLDPSDTYVKLIKSATKMGAVFYQYDSWLEAEKALQVKKFDFIVSSLSEYVSESSLTNVKRALDQNNKSIPMLLYSSQNYVDAKQLEPLLRIASLETLLVGVGRLLKPVLDLLPKSFLKISRADSFSDAENFLKDNSYAVIVSGIPDGRNQQEELDELSDFNKVRKEVPLLFYSGKKDLDFSSLELLTDRAFVVLNLKTATLVQLIYKIIKEL